MIEKIFNSKKVNRDQKWKVCKRVRDQKVWKQVKDSAHAVIIGQRDKRKITFKTIPYSDCNRDSKCLRINFATYTLWLVPWANCQKPCLPFPMHLILLDWMLKSIWAVL